MHAAELMALSCEEQRKCTSTIPGVQVTFQVLPFVGYLPRCMHLAYNTGMIGRTSSATEKALKLHAKGHSIREAAKLAGIAPSTLFRALKKIKEKSDGR
jgi:transcriptional regulator of acetoin/glycerol metabolism